MEYHEELVWKLSALMEYHEVGVEFVGVVKSSHSWGAMR